MNTTLATLAQRHTMTPVPDGRPIDIVIAQPGMLAVFVIGFLLFLAVRRQIVKGSH
jgi:hypothetical protein